MELNRVHVLMCGVNPGLADYLWADLSAREGQCMGVHSSLASAAESCRWHNERCDADYWVETHIIDTTDCDDVVRKEYRR